MCIIKWFDKKHEIKLYDGVFMRRERRESTRMIYAQCLIDHLIIIQECICHYRNSLIQQ